MIAYTSNTPQTINNINKFTDLLMGTMAAQLEVQIKTSGNTPIDKGNLRSSARSVRLGPNRYEVVDTAAYAAAQEVGHRRSRVGNLILFKNHPRGGGAHFFQKSIVTVLARRDQYISSARKAAGMEEIL